MSAIAARKAQLAAQKALQEALVPAAAATSPQSDAPKVAAKRKATSKVARTQRRLRRDEQDHFSTESVGHEYDECDRDARAEAVEALVKPQSDEARPGSFSPNESSPAVKSKGPMSGSKHPWFTPVWPSKDKRGRPRSCNIAWSGPSSDATGSGRASSSQRDLYLCLPAGQVISFIGAARLTVLGGDVKVNDVPVSQGRSRTLFSPSTDPLPILRAGPSVLPQLDEASAADLPDAGLWAPSLYGCIIVLRPLKQTGAAQLARVCPLAGQDPFWAADRHEQSSEAPQTSSLKLITAREAEEVDFDFYQTPPSWQTQWSSLLSDETIDKAEADVFLVRGPKGAGKSTFAHTLFHILSSSCPASPSACKSGVAYLDLDLGQPQYGPPGSVALYFLPNTPSEVESWPLCSPSWLSSLHCKPLLSHYIGQTTPRDVPGVYIDSVASLMRYYNIHLRAQNIRLIVNTMGWTKGLGAEMNAQVECLVRPTHIYDLIAMHNPWAHSEAPASGNDGEIAPAVALPESFVGPPLVDRVGNVLGPGPRITAVQAMGIDLKSTVAASASSLKSLPAADQRILTIMTHLHYRRSNTQRVGDGPLQWTTPSWDFRAPLLTRRPFIVDVRSGLPGGIHFVPNSAEYGSDSAIDVGKALAALNGEIVGLVSLDEGGSDGRDFDSDIASDAAWRRVLSPRPLGYAVTQARFLCLALIRSIDVEAGHLHLLCPPDVFSGRSPPQQQQQQPAPSETVPVSLPAGPGGRLAIVKAANVDGNGAADGSSTLVDTPVWAFLDAKCVQMAKNGRLPVLTGDGALTTRPDHTVAGVPFAELPYLQWPEQLDTASTEMIVGSEKRRIRRNLMRKAQQ
ncbi:unnamed protein product [Parajaminaea phylloscopi]